jgi:glycosyltransferase involved in cell wall biosynthesis
MKGSAGSNTSAMQKRLFVSWEPSNSRSATLAREFSAECVFVHYLALKKPLLAPIKYVLQSFKTWRILRDFRPEVVFVQNPPLFSPLAVWLYCGLKGVPFILDSHTGVFLEPKWRWLGFLHAFLVRRARVSIVTNEYLGGIVESWRGKYFVFPDVPTEFPDARKISDLPKDFVLVVNSFSYDEPLEEVIKAARQLPEVSFAITGDVRRCPRTLRDNTPDNVRFTGFVSRSEYVNLLNSADAAVVLTKEDHTMQRGAYEAMSLCTPIVTSNWPLLRETFFKGTCYTDNTTETIIAALRKILANKEKYRADIEDLKKQRRAMWAEKLEQFSDEYLQS